MLWLKVRKSARGRGWRGADEPFFGTGASLRRRWFKMDDSLVAPVDYKVCVWRRGDYDHSKWCVVGVGHSDHLWSI